MKKNQKLAFILFNLALFIFAGSFKPATAQEDDLSREPHKYEIAVDLIDFFSGGYPNKVLFKINNINGNKVTGAYRFGLGMRYSLFKREGKYDDLNYELWQKSEKTRLAFLFGYEKRKMLNNKVTLYYGADIESSLSIKSEMENQSGDGKFVGVSISPLAGVIIPLTANLSTSFEAAVKNYFYFDKNQVSGNEDNQTKDFYYSTSVSLPYSLTINYKF